MALEEGRCLERRLALPHLRGEQAGRRVAQSQMPQSNMKEAQLLGTRRPETPGTHSQTHLATPLIESTQKHVVQPVSQRHLQPACQCSLAPRLLRPFGKSLGKQWLVPALGC